MFNDNIYGLIHNSEKLDKILMFKSIKLIKLTIPWYNGKLLLALMTTEEFKTDNMISVFEKYL